LLGVWWVGYEGGVAEGVAARFAYAAAGIVLRIRVTPGTRSKQQQYQKQRISY
jgi:hypothetical protein